MRVRKARPAAIAAAVAVLATLAGCGSTAPGGSGPVVSAPAIATQQAGPAAYVDAVGRLLAPPAELARIAAAQGRNNAPAAPPRADIEALVSRSEAELAALRAVDPGGQALRLQRDRLARAYDDVVTTMRTAVEPVSEGRRAESRRVAFELLAALQELPSATS